MKETESITGTPLFLHCSNLKVFKTTEPCAGGIEELSSISSLSCSPSLTSCLHGGSVYMLPASLTAPWMHWLFQQHFLSAQHTVTEIWALDSLHTHTHTHVSTENDICITDNYDSDENMICKNFSRMRFSSVIGFLAVYYQWAPVSGDTDKTH